MQIAAVFPHRHPGHIGDGIDGLVLRADTQQGIRRQIGVDGGIQQTGFLIRDAIEIIAIFPCHHRTAAHAARRVQRAAHVRFAAILIPAPGAGGKLRAVLRQSVLAHHVDRGRRVAEPVQQAVGAAQDLHPLIHRHVLRRAGGIAQQRRHAVQFERIDLEAARIPRGGQQHEGGAGDAGGARHHRIQRCEILLLHLLAIDHADRLSHFTRFQRDFPQRGDAGSHIVIPRRRAGGHGEGIFFYVRFGRRILRQCPGAAQRAQQRAAAHRGRHW
ncbi:hypothetical protein UUU_26890 (plasmid) [Klebsiella pneumoniae subsp. pneumoniae DSM 30104 = JCM 1662 = NBRC 14940]|nr:hypothetical protein UUU_26890 [Klebsiella pneumoniae subsp. pneumoniae DSM 30104 = JCM 1662 = NBRC 14940]